MDKQGLWPRLSIEMAVFMEATYYVIIVHGKGGFYGQVKVIQKKATINR